MLHLHRAERADLLVEVLGDLLAGTPLADPMDAEVVAVPTRGVERWLTQKLSHRLGTAAGGADGVCANLDFPFPGTLIGQAVSAASGVAAADDPWHPERCVWPLIEVVDAHGEDPVLAPLVAHLEAATPQDRGGRPLPLRRYATARHLADLFDHYGVHRPGLVLDWAAGRRDGEPWQAHLWRLLRRHIGVPSPAERYAGAAVALAGDPGIVDLPERVSVYGLTRLPGSYLQILEALAAVRDVHLFLLHPSARLWEVVASALPDPQPGLARLADPTAALPAHPLLRSWGRDAREMQLVLATRRVAGGEHRRVPPDRTTILGRLQADIRSDRPPPGPPTRDRPDERPVIDRGDRTLQIHSCHGRSRQVEVLRDALLHLLAEDPTLEPRDVIVMCPDIESFAPHIHAIFGPEDPTESDGPGATRTGLPRLRVRLADRSVRQTNPLLAVASELLMIAGSRVTASQVLDLAARPPVARRFRFDQEDLSALQRWVQETGIRWGLDAEHRQPWSLDHVAANTWEAGLDRLLLGVTMAESGGRTFGAVLPYEDVPSSEVELAGRLAELIERLTAVLDQLQGSQPVAGWVDSLVAGTELLAEGEEEWQHDQLRRVLADAKAAGPGPNLSREEARDLLAFRLQGRPTVANFRTGDLTICTLVPMRSVPHRVVALLGLDDGAFPRHPELDGDDLLLIDPEVGDRDRRSEDRQLLLDALLAATDHLLITYSGRDERTNRARPPAVPIAELLDTVDATMRGPDGRPARAGVVTEHPLQPFDPRNFQPGELDCDQAWSYDLVQLAGARASAVRTQPEPWLTQPLPPLVEPVLQLDDLVRFVEFPVRAFLRRRFGLYLASREDELDDRLPIDLDALEKWGVGDRLLQARLGGTDAEQAAVAERSRGLLPPAGLADRVLQEVGAEVDEIAGAVSGYPPGPADSLDIHLDLPGGRTIIGAVPNRRGDTVVTCVYSRLGPKHRLAAWVRFLAVSAGRPELGLRSVTVGRGQLRQPPQMSRLEPIGPADAAARLAEVVELWGLGMMAPVPIACDTTAAWAEAIFAGKSIDDAYAAAKQAWDGGRWEGERHQPEHRQVWPDHHQLPDDSLFRTLAARLWDPFLGHERLGPVR